MPDMRMPQLVPLALGALGLVACGGGVTVRRTAAQAPPRPADCELELLRKAPERPHDVLAELESHVTRVPPDGALAVLKPVACALGADAIVVERNAVLNVLGHVLVAGSAIRYRPAPPAPTETQPVEPPAVTPPAPSGEPAR